MDHDTLTLTDSNSGGHRRLASSSSDDSSSSNNSSSSDDCSSSDNYSSSLELVVSQPDGSRCYDAGTKDLEIEWNSEGSCGCKVLVQLMHGTDGTLVQNLTDDPIRASKEYLNPCLDSNLESSDEYYVRVMSPAGDIVGDESPAFCISSSSSFEDCSSQTEAAALTDSLAVYAGVGGALFCVMLLALCCCFAKRRLSRGADRQRHMDTKDPVPEVVVKQVDMEMPPVAFYATTGHPIDVVSGSGGDGDASAAAAAATGGGSVGRLPVAAGEAEPVAVAVGVPAAAAAPAN
uniref:Uncharacterized protein n=1 Tax=Heterosigma akashiwo TaxID=2829 RepID=A0A6V1PHU8_HETAK